MNLLGAHITLLLLLLPRPQANSTDRTDLLPGLCVLAQRWVHDVAFGSFRCLGVAVPVVFWPLPPGWRGGCYVLSALGQPLPFFRLLG